MHSPANEECISFIVFLLIFFIVFLLIRQFAALFFYYNFIFLYKKHCPFENFV